MNGIGDAIPAIGPLVGLALGPMLLVGGVAVLLERLKGETGKRSSAFYTGAGNALAFFTASQVGNFDEHIALVTAIAVAAQLVIAAWTQRFRERHLHRDSLAPADNVCS